MGCTSSSLNDLPAVALCRQRCAFLHETIRHSHALSAAHLSYLNSLQSIALSLQLPPHSSDSDSDHPNHDDQSYPQSHIPFPAAAYMKHNVTPFQLYEQMTTSDPHALPMGQYSSFSHTNPNNPSPYHPHQTFGAYYSSASPCGPQSSPFASSSHHPPPSIYSPWGCYDEDGLYSQHRTSQELKQIKEQEGIPDLEDDDEYELVSPDDGAGNHPKFTKHNHTELTEASLIQTMPMASMEELEHQVHADQERFGDAFEVASELVELQFRRASESAMEIATILDAGPLSYYPNKHAARQVALPLSLMVSSRPSISKVYKIGPRSLELEGDLLNRSRSLSSTLHKLHLWEKKLYKEVKAEEKIRVLHDRKCRMLKRLDERGADFQNVDTTQTSIKNLSTKIKMAIQVVDLISEKINKIRDEELWPQVNELIQGLTRMWKSMLECHRIQCEVIREAGNLGWMGHRKKGGVAHEATKQVEQEVMNWGVQFCCWISAQKRYVRALNNWLLKCLMEETVESVVSPGRMGAPPVFVICNRWSQAMERMCEKEVVERMSVFMRRVIQTWEQERLEIMLDKDVEGNEGRDDQKLQKQIEEAKQKMVAALREVNINEEGEDNVSTSLEGSLLQILEAMERFTGTCAGLYQELLQGSDEHIHA
ncbi:hypothetical protein QN277_004898 [Acacia crassicarpa]|uniref:Nitrate regulatory gene2 protein-like n=1 Tax=Acacia crassicarpa TaxID=499986 RepID=A0AAE1IXZ5_9FABA|nr:hypothetical protein QN277_004898 [Acacia crassicarpa]